ncbi:hypothetical protein AAE478_005393 [Parahypoxylon ruwenzoriense]
MMAFDTSRPSTQNGGSQPPTSRFLEGSMNDRVSAVPPPQFLGPEQLREYEKMFYAETHAAGAQRETRSKQRCDRPLSVTAQVQSGGENTTPDRGEHIITHRKSASFFSRVRDALAVWNSSSSRGGGGGGGGGGGAQKQQEFTRKHTSLQEPLPRQQQSMPSMLTHTQRPENLRAAKSHSEMYAGAPQLPSFGGGDGGVNRPSREDVLKSYNQLMASGFFQSHAIQSTRHACPTGASAGAGAGAGARRSEPSTPSIPFSPYSPVPPPRISSLEAVATAWYSSPPQSPITPDFNSHKVAATKSRGRPPAIKLSDEAGESQPPQSKDSRYMLRGRKRNRANVEEYSPPNSPLFVLSPTASTSSFTQPLKRVAKKLRKTPSSPPAPPAATRVPACGDSACGGYSVASPDGILRLPPSRSTGGTLYLKEQAVRMRSPSPAALDVGLRKQPQSYYYHHYYQDHQDQLPLPLPQQKFPNGLRGEGNNNKLRKRSKSASLRSRSMSVMSVAPTTTATSGSSNWEIIGDRMSMDSTSDGEAVTRKNGSPRELTTGMPLKVVPDANRGIPSVPRIPDQYYVHKPERRAARRSGDENMEVEWQVGAAL